MRLTPEKTEGAYFVHQSLAYSLTVFITFVSDMFLEGLKDQMLRINSKSLLIIQYEKLFVKLSNDTEDKYITSKLIENGKETKLYT